MGIISSIMNYDYCITQKIYIYYNDNKFSVFDLSKDYRYYNLHYDEDKDDYEEKMLDYKQLILRPQTVPVVLFENNKFNKFLSEKKYKTLIEKNITNSGKTFQNVVQIIKCEERKTRV